MPILRFEGYSDDTFGEVAHFKDDYDNCASGKQIEYLVLGPATTDALLFRLKQELAARFVAPGGGRPPR